MIGILTLTILSLGGAQSMTNHIDIVKAFVERMEARDLGALEAALSETATLELPFPVPGLPARFDGREAVMAYFGQAANNFSSIKFVNKEFNETGAFVFAEMSSEITTADGRPYSNRYIWRFELQGGKIVSILEYANPILFARTFGIPLTAQ
jgi:uncharacterized protein